MRSKANPHKSSMIAAALLSSAVIIQLAASQLANLKEPHFSAPIGNVSALLGRDVRLVCQVEDLANHQVAWLKEETRTILSIDTNIIITNYRIFLIPDELGRRWVLHIKDVRESDRGFYQCQINTKPTKSQSGYLEVVVPPTFIESQSSQVAEALERRNVTLECRANGHPRPSISWRRDDGEPIRLRGQFAGSSSQQQQQQQMQSFAEVKSDKLTLVEVDNKMAGIYLCIASNGVQSQVSKRIPLYVKFEPRVSIQSSELGASNLVQVTFGQPLELVCLIEAFPKPQSHWWKRRRRRRRRRRWQRPRRQNSAAHATWRPAKELAHLNQSIQVTPDGATGQLQQQHTAAEWQLLYRRPRDNTHGGDDDDDETPDKEIGGQDNAAAAADGDDDENVQGQSAAKIAVEIESEQEQDAEGEGEEEEEERRRTTDSLGGSSSSSSASSAYVTTKQIPINANLYKLRLQIAQVNPGDLGEYVCVAQNGLGRSESSVLVVGGGGVLGSGDAQADEQQAQDQRPGGIASGAVMAHGRAKAAAAATASGRSRVVHYDENYLRTIKSRQQQHEEAAAAAAAAAQMKLQQMKPAQRRAKSSGGNNGARASPPFVSGLELAAALLAVSWIIWRRP